MASDELIDFDIIENSKENIQPLREGRSAKALAAVLSPNPSGMGSKDATLDGMKTLNDAIRAEYELELQSIDDADDPLDIYDRYVKWTLNAYPSAQATKQSQLLPLLERATKAFLTTAHCKNDPRYLKLWLHYIRLFSDAPRETFAFLARHNIGEMLGLFYEEFAAWLEGAGRWNQAAEVYEMGIQKGARPAERLLRKYSQFQQRFDARPQEPNGPSSPALPTVRPALAAKMDPFAPAAAAASENPQAAQAQAAGARPTGRGGKPKMAIFSDADGAAVPPEQPPSQGWDSIGSIKERKKENTMEARPWAGETLKAGGRVGKAAKMEVFKDPSRMNDSNKHVSSKPSAAALNPKAGRCTRVFVCMEAIYPNEHEEFSFEELRAMYRGWAQRDWKRRRPDRSDELVTDSSSQPVTDNSSQPVTDNSSQPVTDSSTQPVTDNSSQPVTDSSTQPVTDISRASLAEMPPPKTKTKRLKVREVKQEVQTVKTRLESPTGPKMRKKNSAEPTMTFHSKAATNEIYDLFNRPSKAPRKEEPQSREESDYEDAYSTAGESTGTGAATSVFGDDTFGSMPSGHEDNTCSQPDSVSPWSDYTASKHAAQGKKAHKHHTSSSLDLTEYMGSSQNQTQTSRLDGAGAFDTQAIAAIANQDFDELDTRAIALIAGSPTPLRPYRDPMAVAHNKLPVMTPIAEQTESSVAPSTLWKGADYFKTPSRRADDGRFESASKLQFDDLLMSSPPKQLSLRSPGRREEEARGTRPGTRPATADAIIDQCPDPIIDDAIIDQCPDPIIDDAIIDQCPDPIDNAQHPDPIINDAQCNPCDRSIRQQILEALQPLVSSYQGFADCSTETFGHASIIKAYTDKLAKQKPGKFSPRKSQGDRSRPGPAPQLSFKRSTRVYTVKRELGKGAFAPVHLVESSEHTSSSHTATTTAREDEKCPPETLVWEFHMLRLISARLPPSCRTLQSLVRAHECHLYRDECYLVLSYSPQGTLLDLVNHFRAANASAGKQIEGTGMDEVLVMFFAVELLRTMASLHSVGILHGDLKADNALVRLDPAVPLAAPYSPTGAHGWSAKGLTLIDFGRAIDTANFPRRTRFIADWPPQPEDCVEIRDCKPWKWQIDFYGAAAVIHSLLFGKHLATVPVPVAASAPASSSSSAADSDITLPIAMAAKQEYRVKEPFKRYWDRHTWELVFSLDDQQQHFHLETAISRLEAALLADGERRDLRAAIRRAERFSDESGSR
ncbi:hypothetical protein DV735_g2898, partial [Chaetothyriales sp. CBS 134920]